MKNRHQVQRWDGWGVGTGRGNSLCGSLEGLKQAEFWGGMARGAVYRPEIGKVGRGLVGRMHGVWTSS